MDGTICQSSLEPHREAFAAQVCALGRASPNGPSSTRGGPQPAARSHRPAGASGARLAGTVAVHQLARKGATESVSPPSASAWARASPSSSNGRNPMALTQHDIDLEIAAEHATYEKRTGRRPGRTPAP
ncbi:hypothetical protein ACRAWF_26345 [Streptomyces sp. L7]